MDKILYLCGCNDKLELDDINGVVTNYTEWGSGSWKPKAIPTE